MKPAPPTDRRAELARALAELRERPSSEAVHAFRVAAARTSVWLEIGARRALRDDLRRLRRAASRVRDLDVVCERDLAPDLARTLAAERASRADELARTVEDADTEVLLAALALVPDPDPVHVRSTLQRLKRRALRAGDGLATPDDDPGAFHDLRRRVRRLRYALECTGADVDELRALQDELGALNNLAVETRIVESHERGATDVERDVRRRDEIRAQRKRAIEAWRALRDRIQDL